MDIYTIDFETYWASDYSLGKVPTTDYVRDARFETIGVGIRDPAGEVYWLDHEAFVAALDAGLREELAQAAILCHHTHFDGSILAWHYGVNPALWLDTLSMSRPLLGIDVGGSLAKLATHFGVGTKGKEVINSRGKRRNMFSPEEWLRFGEYCKNDVRLTWGIFQRLITGEVAGVDGKDADGAAMGAYPERELALIDLTIRMFTEPSFVLDESRMRAYHASEIARKEELLQRLNQDRSVLMSNPKFAGLLESLGVAPPKKISGTTGKPTFAFAAKDLEFVALKDHDDPMVRAAVEARLGVKSTQAESRAKRFLSLGSNGQRVPVYLKYCSAHTTRWGGGDRSNMQNLERTDEENPNKGVHRQCLMAPPGEILVVVDSGQIEARGTAWLAEEMDLLADFAASDAAAARGEKVDTDVYTKLSTVVYKRHITKKDKKERSVGKIGTLALGYGMGFAHLSSEMLKGPMGAKPIRFTQDDARAMGVDVGAFSKGLLPRLQKRGWNYTSVEEALRDNVATVLSFDDLLPHVAACDHLVRVYRQKNQRITQLWWETCPRIVAAMAAGTEVPCGPLFIEKNALRLPSGLRLRYPDLRVDDDGGATYWNGKHRQSLHGGVLTENIIQALSRVVISDQLLDIAGISREKGYRIVTTTHDEIVLCVPVAKGEEALADLLRVMKTVPAWAQGWPLNAEGAIAQRYGDAK